MMAPMWTELRASREAKGLSLDSASHKIRIPAKYLAALEQGDFRSLPSMTYGLGFLRSYCEFLGLNPEPYLDNFRASSQKPAIPRRERAREAVMQMPWARELMTWAAVCALVAFGWLTYSVVFRPDADDSQTHVRAETLDRPMVVPPATPQQ